RSRAGAGAARGVLRRSAAVGGLQRVHQRGADRRGPGRLRRPRQLQADGAGRPVLELAAADAGLRGRLGGHRPEHARAAHRAAAARPGQGHPGRGERAGHRRLDGPRDGGRVLLVLVPAPRRHARRHPGLGRTQPELALHHADAGRHPGQCVARHRLLDAGVPGRAQRRSARVAGGGVGRRRLGLAAAAVRDDPADPPLDRQQPDAHHAADPGRLRPDLRDDEGRPGHQEPDDADLHVPGVVPVLQPRLRHRDGARTAAHRGDLLAHLRTADQGGGPMSVIGELTSARRGPSRVAVWIVLAIVAIAFFLPFLWLLVASIQPGAALSAHIAWKFSVKNFADVLNADTIYRPMLNSLIISGFTALITVFAAIFAAYPLSRYRSRFGRIFLYSILFSTGLPITAVMVPVYTIYSQFELT